MTWGWRGWRDGYQLRELAFLPDDPSSIPRPQGWLTALCNFTLKDVHRHSCRQKCTYKIKINILQHKTTLIFPFMFCGSELLQGFVGMRVSYLCIITLSIMSKKDFAYMDLWLILQCIIFVLHVVCLSCGFYSRVCNYMAVKIWKCKFKLQILLKPGLSLSRGFLFPFVLFCFFVCFILCSKEGRSPGIQDHHILFF